MKLNLTVDNIRSARVTLTGKEQAIVKAKDASHNLDGVYLDNDEGWTLDQELVAVVMTKGEAEELSREFDRESGEVSKWYPAMGRLAAQLRPDPPPPFMEPSEAAQDAWKQRHCVPLVE